MKPRRVFCASCGKVAGRIELMEHDTPMHEHSRVIVPAGSLAVVVIDTAAWPPTGKPRRWKLTTVMLLPPRGSSGWTMFSCPFCDAGVRVDVARATDPRGGDLGGGF